MARLRLRPIVWLIAGLAALGLALVLAGRKPITIEFFEVPLFTAPLGGARQAVEIHVARGEWPQVVPAGEDVPVRVTLDSTIADRPGDGLLSIEDLYASNAAQVEARLELRDVTVNPAGSILQRLAPEAPAGLFWRLNARRTGTYEGTLWVYVNPGGADRQLVFARPVTVTAVDVLGVPPHLVRRAGWASLALALLGGIPALVWSGANQSGSPSGRPSAGSHSAES